VVRVTPVRVGIVGHGLIGRELAARLDTSRELELAFVAVRDPTRHPGIPAHLLLEDLDHVASRSPDLIVEAAGGAVTVEQGAAFLEVADYLPLSATALADDDLRARLLAAADRFGHRLLLPAGALVGAPSLAAIGRAWASVTVTMEKPPASIDDANSRPGEPAVAAPTTLHDGAVREAARRFPRNVNAMVVAALATLGLDQTRAVLVADPTRRDARLIVEAEGTDGSSLRLERRQPLAGVSGTEMGAAAWQSVLAATGSAPSMAVV
jgi:aspartate dehydrogenase